MAPLDLGTPSPIAVLRALRIAVASEALRQAALRERVERLDEIIEGMEREATEALTLTEDDEIVERARQLGQRHCEDWRTGIDIALGAFKLGGIPDAIVLPLGTAAWQGLASETERALPGLSLTARLDVRAMARLLCLAGTEVETDKVDLRAELETAFAQADDSSLQFLGLLEGLTVVGTRGGARPEVGEKLARATWTLTSASVAPDRAVDARRWAEAKEAELRGTLQMRALEEMRPSLMQTHPDKWVIVANGKAIGFADGFQEAAEKAGRLRPDGTALIAPVDERDEIRVPGPDRWRSGGAD